MGFSVLPWKPFINIALLISQINLINSMFYKSPTICYSFIVGIIWLLSGHHMEYEDNNEQFIFEDMEVMTDFELHNLCLKWRALQPYCLSTEVLLDSGKFEYLRTILPNIRKEGDRVLLFSQFTMMLDVLELFLNDMEYRYLRLDGQTAVSD
eukprot:Pgem_evm1s3916